MSKSPSLLLTIFTIGIVLGTGSTVFAQGSEKKGSATKSETQPPAKMTGEDSSASTTDTEPSAEPDQIVVEEDFWFPFRYSFADAIHDAHVDFRHGREQAAHDEIEKAMMWMKMAKGMTVNKQSESDLDIAISDLRDLAMFLKRGDLLRAAEMEKTFARAATALSKHHKFNADRAVAKNDLKLAGRHLSAAAYNVKAAARCANHEYGDDVVEIFESYFPHGSYDETVVVEENKLEAALDVIAREIETLEQKVTKASK